MSGLELAKLVQQLDDEIRITVMSAFDLDKDQLKEIRKDEYLRKPMHVTQLVQTVRELLIEPRFVTG